MGFPYREDTNNQERLRATYMKREFVIPYKPSYSAWPVTIDMSSWLGSETISGVTFSAKRLDTGVDATSIITDTDKNTNTATEVKPFIRGGVNGIPYLIVMKVISSEDAQEEIYLRILVVDQ